MHQLFFSFFALVANCFSLQIAHITSRPNVTVLSRHSTMSAVQNLNHLYRQITPLPHYASVTFPQTARHNRGLCQMDWVKEVIQSSAERLPNAASRLIINQTFLFPFNIGYNKGMDHNWLWNFFSINCLITFEPLKEGDFMQKMAVIPKRLKQYFSESPFFSWHTCITVWFLRFKSMVVVFWGKITKVLLLSK